uniref:Secreted protein n=1 Tax=Steinernema glaseri TaxID=37863 RepID=A0A1I8ADS0_9BILA
MKLVFGLLTILVVVMGAPTTGGNVRRPDATPSSEMSGWNQTELKGIGKATEQNLDIGRLNADSADWNEDVDLQKDIEMSTTTERHDQEKSHIILNVMGEICLVVLFCVMWYWLSR